MYNESTMASITAVRRMLEEARELRFEAFNSMSKAVNQINQLEEQIGMMEFALRDLEEALVNYQATEEAVQGGLNGSDVADLIMSRFYVDFEDMVSLDTSETRHGVEVIICVDNSDMEQAVKDQIIEVVDDLIRDGKIIIKEGNDE